MSREKDYAPIMPETKYTIEHRNDGTPTQVILDCGLNVFALQLMIESYTQHPNPIPIKFRYRGVTIAFSLTDFEVSWQQQSQKAVTQRVTPP